MKTKYKKRYSIGGDPEKRVNDVNLDVIIVDREKQCGFIGLSCPMFVSGRHEMIPFDYDRDGIVFDGTMKLEESSVYSDYLKTEEDRDILWDRLTTLITAVVCFDKFGP